MEKWSNEDYQQVFNEVARRSIVDPEFRSLALSDATAAIAKVSTKPLPADLKFKFVDNSGSSVTIPLPDPIAGADEISELELESVAGGSGDTVGGSWGR